ncbi:MAG: hypothetical protein FWJ66_09590 [Caldibacillus sp.]
MYKWLVKSARENIPVVIIYRSLKGNFSKRTIMVHKIHADYIKAFCYSKMQYRTFKIERIYAVEPYRERRLPSA